MAYESASDWLGALDRTFSSAAQPLIAYNLERRRVAERDLQRQQQLQDQQRQYAHEELMVDKHAQAYARELDAQQERRTKAEQKIQRDNALAEARGMGIGKDQLPDDAPYSDILVAVGKSRGKRLIASAKSAAAAVKAYADYQGQTAREVTQRIAADAVGQLTPKEINNARLTQSEISQIAMDPDAVNGLLAKAIREKNDAGIALLRRIKGDISNRFQTELDLAAKTNPRLSGLAENFRLSHDAYINLEKQGGYDEASGIEASEALIKDTFPQQQQKTPETSPFTPPPMKTSIAPPIADAGTGRENFLRRWWYGKDQPAAFPGVGVSGNVNAPGMSIAPTTSAPRAVGTIQDSMEALRRASLGIPLAQFPSVPVGGLNPTQPAIDPSILATMRLQSSMGDAANNQLFSTPIAFPPFKPVVPAPDESGVAIVPWAPVR